MGGREAVRVARLSAALGPATGLLVACWLACLVACSLAAWLGQGVAAQLGLEAKSMLVAIALLLAAFELALLGPGRTPTEPTRSFGAIALVLSSAQLTAAAGFLVFALAGATAAPWLAGAGGALGSGAVLTGAWYAGAAWEKRVPLKLLRHGVAGLLLLAALATLVSARGLLG